MGYRSKASGAQILQICSSVRSLAAFDCCVITMQAFLASGTLVQKLDGCQNCVPLVVLSMISNLRLL